MSQKPFDALSYSLVELFDGDDHSAAEAFHDSTKMTRINYGTIVRRVESIMRDPELILTMSRAWKEYAAVPRVPLPASTLGDCTLQDALMRRRSVTTRFGEGAMSMDQLSSILGFSFGMTLQKEVKGKDAKVGLRAAPSAGGLFPVEIYPVAMSVDGLPSGVYHYQVRNHSLEQLRLCDTRAEFLKLQLTPYVDLASSCSAMFILTTVMPRTLTKYLFRGYRFLSYDVGATLENLYLTTTAVGLSTCAIGGFFDDEVGRWLGVDNVDETVMMLFAAGPPEPQGSSKAPIEAK
jgi:SagB-type dehydrogenase family enzyme